MFRVAVRFCHGIDLLARSTYPPERAAAFHSKKIAGKGGRTTLDRLSRHED